MNTTNQYVGFLGSKSLWTNTTLFDIPVFNFKDLDVSSLASKNVTFKIQENEVLGKRAEHFFKHCIITSTRYRLITSYVQIFKDNITIGELDYLIEDLQTKEILHIELVYKFYIYDPQFKNELHRWIGPNRKDSLLEKIEKLKKNQLPLLHKKETYSILENLNLDAKHIQQKVCYLAQLFTPISFEKKAIPHLNNKCVVGHWIRFRDFISDLQKHFLYYIPEKKNWPVDPKHCPTWFTHGEILPVIESKLSQKKSPLLWRKDSEDSYSKFFVVWW